MEVHERPFLGRRSGRHLGPHDPRRAQSAEPAKVISLALEALEWHYIKRLSGRIYAAPARHLDESAIGMDDAAAASKNAADSRRPARRLPFCDGFFAAQPRLRQRMNFQLLAAFLIPFSFITTTATSTARADVAERCPANAAFANMQWVKMEGSTKMISFESFTKKRVIQTNLTPFQHVSSTVSVRAVPELASSVPGLRASVRSLCESGGRLHALRGRLHFRRTRRVR